MCCGHERALHQCLLYLPSRRLIPRPGTWMTRCTWLTHMAVELLLCLIHLWNIPESSKRIFQHWVSCQFCQDIVEDIEYGGELCLAVSKYADIVSICQPSHQYVTWPTACWRPLKFLATIVNPGHTTCNTCHFDVPRSRTVFGSRSFSVAAPQAWNELPADIRQINTFFTFKRHLKTFLFKAVYTLQ